MVVRNAAPLLRPDGGPQHEAPSAPCGEGGVSARESDRGHGAAAEQRAEGERERLLRELRDAHEELRADLDATNRLLNVGTLFVKEDDAKPVLRAIVDAAIAISGADFGTIQLVDPVSGDLQLAASIGLPDWWVDFWNRTSRGAGSCGTALERRERTIVEDVEHSPTFVGTPALEVQRRAGVAAVQSTPIIGRSGEPIGMLSTHYKAPGRPKERALRRLDLLARQAADILERATREADLRASEQRYRTLFESIDEGLCVIEVLFDEEERPYDYRFVDVNAVFEQQTGISNAIGRRVREIAPSHEAHWFEIYGHVALTGEPRRFESPAVALGRIHDVSAFRIGRPEQHQIAVLFNDISERRRAELEREKLVGELRDALEVAEERGNLLDALMEHIPLGITLADAPDVRIRHVSRYGLELLAKRMDELDGAPAGEHPRLWGAFHADGATPAKPEELPLARAVTHGGQIEGEEWILVRADGERIPILCTAAPIRDRDGNVQGGVMGFQDIRQQKQAEARLLESDRRKDEYLAMLGHELRNPLGAIGTAAELVKTVATDEPAVRRAVEVLGRQAAHMSRIIDGLLDVSRIARGKIHLELAPVEVRHVVEKALEAQRQHIAARGLELVTDLDAGALVVTGDEARLTQVLDNLIGNAIKFTPPPGTITVALRREADCVAIEVRDTGVGMRPEILSTIFEPFYQEPQDVARTSGGLGLGLALAKALVELHHGTMAAASAGPGAGASFVVRLPITRGRVESSTPAALGDAPRRRVLVVEDNEDAADMLKSLLELSGHEVRVAHSGAEALDALRRRGADIVLCDIGLPEMSGEEVARAIRSDPALKHVPLVALTGYGQPDDRRRTAEAGFDDHLTKPVHLDALYAVLRHLVRR
jgi:signal transduction histidine kinase